MPKAWLTTFPSIFAILEFSAFAILSPMIILNDLEPKPKIYNIETWWFLVNGIYHIFISWFCRRAAKQFEQDCNILIASGDTNLYQVYDTYRGWVEKEKQASGLAGYINLIVFFVSFILINRELQHKVIWGQFVAVLYLFLAIRQAYLDQHEKRRLISGLIMKLPKS